MKLKNCFYIASAGLLLVSCANDDMKFGSGVEYSTINLQLTTPQIQTRDYSDGKNANELRYGIYETTDDGSYKYIREVTEEFSGSKNVSLQLANGSSYMVVFWASSAPKDGAATNPYSLDFENKTMTVDYTKAKCNDANLDAFYGVADLGPINGDGSVKVNLTRPLAQINVATNDYKALEELNSNKVPTQSSITIKNVPDQMNLITGTVSGNKTFEDTPTFAMSDIRKEEKFSKDGYEYLAMAYLLVSEDKTTYDVAFNFKSTAGELSREVAQVPVQRNHRTNIFGSILTSNQNALVEITPGFEGDWDEDLDGAKVSFEGDKFVCETPALPKDVTEEEIENKGGVYVNADGETVIFNSDFNSIKTAFAEASEIYLAPNIEIDGKSHQLIVPAEGITVHGNGATFIGQEQDISIDSGSNKFQYEGIVNINLYNLNGVKLWGVATGGATFNINIKQCSLKANGMTDGTHSLLNARGSDGKFNILFEDCYMEDGQLGIHHTYEGTTTVNRCTFKKVGIPINIAKKKADAPSEVIVTNCEFIECGIGAEYSNLDAYKYSAPVRVVDNGGPVDNLTVKVNKCTFKNTKSTYDILLMDERPDKTWHKVNYTVTNCGDYNIKATDDE